jgi:hypothetical protein
MDIVLILVTFQVKFITNISKSSGVIRSCTYIWGLWIFIVGLRNQLFSLKRIKWFKMLWSRIYVLLLIYFINFMNISVIRANCWGSKMVIWQLITLISEVVIPICITTRIIIRGYIIVVSYVIYWSFLVLVFDTIAILILLYSRAHRVATTAKRVINQHRG